MKTEGNSGLIIFLVGARAAGKTTVGRRLALELGQDFVDTDLYMGEIHRITVAEIVAKEGWDGFRRKESAALREVAAPGRVIATGGGMVLAEHNRDFMRANGLVFYLSAPAEVLGARLAADPKAAQRPSLTGLSVVEEAAQVLLEREELYLGAAHHVIDAAEAFETVIESILDKVRAD
jgi:Shikimate kinase